jgi:hypothetical protein
VRRHLPVVSRIARAQTYTTRPVRLIAINVRATETHQQPLCTTLERSSWRYSTQYL